MVINLDPRLHFEEIVVADQFVPSNFRERVSTAKYAMWFKVTGESEEGETVDLTWSRCKNCRQKMGSISKDEANSNRFCDVLTSKILQTRKTKGKIDSLFFHSQVLFSRDFSHCN